MDEKEKKKSQRYGVSPPETEEARRFMEDCFSRLSSRNISISHGFDNLLVAKKKGCVKP